MVHIKETVHLKPTLHMMTPCQEQHNEGSLECVLVVLVYSGLKAPVLPTRKKGQALCSCLGSRKEGPAVGLVFLSRLFSSGVVAFSYLGWGSGQ